MDDVSESKRAVDLLTSRYSIIDFGGEVRYLKNSNVEELLTGEVNPLTTGLNLYRKDNIELFQQRDLEDAGLPVEQKQFREIMDGWRLNPKTKCFRGTDFDPTNDDPNVLNLWRGPIGGQEGDWAVIQEFLLLIICNRDQVKYDYLLDFLAHAIQKPEEKPGVMLFFQGGQGTGVVAAEPHLLIEQKGIQISNRTGLKAVAEGLTPKPTLHRLQPFTPRL